MQAASTGKWNPIGYGVEGDTVKVTTIGRLRDVAQKDAKSLNGGDGVSNDIVVDLPIAGATDLRHEAETEGQHPGFNVTAGSALRGSSFFKEPSAAKQAAAMSALNAAIDANGAKREARVESFEKLNDVAIRRLKAVYVDEMFTAYGSDGDAQYEYALALAADALSLGYALPQNVVEGISGTTTWAMKAILKAMRSTRGALWDYKPMYPDFPKQVEDATARELIVNALAHYTGDLFGLRIMPDYEPSPRLPLLDGGKMEKLGLATAGDLADVAVKLLSAGQVLSEQDKADLKTLAADKTIMDIIEEKLDGVSTKIRENFVWVAGEFDGELHDWALKQFTLPTDALRYACKLSGGDESLAEPTKFHLTRSQRRDVARALTSAVFAMGDRLDDLSDQFARHAEEWKQLARILHPHELLHKGAISAEASSWIAKTQNGVVRSFDSRVEEGFRLLADGKGDGLLLTVLSQRHGEFARRIVELLRKTPAAKHETVLSAFSNIVDKVSTPVLVQLWNLLQYPAGETSGVPENRVVVAKTPKGSKVDVVKNRIMEDVDHDEAIHLVSMIERALIGRKKDMLVELGEHAGEYAVPLGTRSASAGTRIPARGSRIKIEGYDKGKSVVRMFMHWHDTGGRRVDLDLSAMVVTADFSSAEVCWYGGLRTEANTIVHSGDITSAPNGAAEFIDAKAPMLLAKGYRYLVMTVHSYTGQTFNVVPEAAAGVMLRSKLGREGEIFDARTVEQKFDLTHESRNATPLMIDLETGEIIWLDLDIVVSSWRSIADASNMSVTIQAMMTAAWGKPMTVSELASLETTLVTRTKNAEGEDVLATVDGAVIEDESKVIKIEGWDSENTMLLL